MLEPEKQNGTPLPGGVIQIVITFDPIQGRIDAQGLPRDTILALGILARVSAMVTAPKPEGSLIQPVAPLRRLP